MSDTELEDRLSYLERRMEELIGPRTTEEERLAYLHDHSAKMKLYSAGLSERLSQIKGLVQFDGKTREL